MLLGWALISDRYFPTANKPSTAIVKGKEVALPGTPPVPNGPTAVRDRAVVLAATPRVRIETPLLAGSVDLKGARLDDLTLTTQRETIAKDSPPSACSRRRDRRTPISPGSAGAAKARHCPTPTRCGPRRATCSRRAAP